MRMIRVGFGVVMGTALLLSVAACKNNVPAGTVAQGGAYDPADVNMAPVSRNASRPTPTRVLGQNEAAQPYQQGEEYPANDPRYNGNQGYGNSDPRYANQPGYGNQPGYEYADQAPPPLPEYAQPPVTRPNTIWTPGYWGHSPTGYYWVPGAYVAPPSTGQVWTPGYWQANGPRYQFHPGYWGKHVGFYGGVPYGGGYPGTGYRGGYWNGDRFRYNRAVYQVDPNVITDYYDQPEQMAYPYGRVSYNGGNGGIPLLPMVAELIALHERHQQPVSYQYQMERRAALDRGQFFEVNRGRPAAYWAPEGWERERPRDVIVEHDGFPGRGHAYGQYKDKEFKDEVKHQDKEFKREDKEFKHEEKHGGGEGRGHGEGHGEGHGDEGHGHGHGKG